MIDKTIKILDEKLKIQEITETTSSSISGGEIKEIMLCIQKLEEKLQQKVEVIEKARKRLGHFADELASDSNAYAVCVDALDILNRYEGDSNG